MDAGVRRAYAVHSLVEKSNDYLRLLAILRALALSLGYPTDSIDEAGSPPVSMFYNHCRFNTLKFKNLIVLLKTRAPNQPKADDRRR